MLTSQYSNGTANSLLGSASLHILASYYQPLIGALGVQMGHYDFTIRDSEKKINHLQSRIHETYKSRDKNEHKFREWQSACKEFHANYDTLAFPGGFDGAYDRILNGDSQAIEAGLCFIEIRPYFFRSGYMYKDLLRKLARAQLKGNDLTRYIAVKEAYLEYRANRNT